MSSMSIPSGSSIVAMATGPPGRAVRCGAPGRSRGTEPRQHRLDVHVERRQDDTRPPNAAGVGSGGSGPVGVEGHELDHAGVGMGGVAEEHRPQCGGAHREERGPVPVKDVVHEDLEADAVAIEAEAGVDVAHDDGGVVEAGARHFPRPSAGSIGLHSDTPPSAARTCPVTQSSSNRARTARATPSGVPTSPRAERSATRSGSRAGVWWTRTWACPWCRGRRRSPGCRRARARAPPRGPARPPPPSTRCSGPSSDRPGSPRSSSRPRRPRPGPRPPGPCPPRAGTGTCPAGSPTGPGPTRRSTCRATTRTRPPRR